MASKKLLRGILIFKDKASNKLHIGILNKLYRNMGQGGAMKKEFVKTLHPKMYVIIFDPSVRVVAQMV